MLGVRARDIRSFTSGSLENSPDDRASRARFTCSYAPYWRSFLASVYGPPVSSASPMSPPVSPLKHGLIDEFGEERYRAFKRERPKLVSILRLEEPPTEQFRGARGATPATILLIP